MVIDVRKLKSAGKSEIDFEFVYVPDNSIITLPDAKFDSDVKISGTLTLGGNDVSVIGRIEYGIAGVCSRCLESANFHNVVEFDEIYSEDENDLDAYPYKKGLVNLTQMVKDKLMFSMPYALYCKEDCKGLCPICGINRNKATCNCKIENF